MESCDESYLLTGYEPKNYDLMETFVESLRESLTQPQFPEQRFLADVDYDDTALEEMLHNAHRVRVCHSQRESLSVGQSSLKQKNFNDEINNFFMHSYYSKNWTYVKLTIKVSMKWKN